MATVWVGSGNSRRAFLTLILGYVATILVKSDIVVCGFLPPLVNVQPTRRCEEPPTYFGSSAYLGGAESMETEAVEKQESLPTFNQQQSKTRSRRHVLASIATAVTSGLAVATAPCAPALADELGQEREAPTIFTGENIMICKKRGPLGACTKQVVRTAENDNDKASKYFRDPEVALRNKIAKEKEQSSGSSKDDSVLIQKLREQTEVNKERNTRLVRQKTLQNDQSAAFGPLDRQVVILSSDGESFSLLESPVAMRLKKMGLINNQRQFVREPTDEEYNQARREAQESEGGLLGTLLRKVTGGDADEEAPAEQVMLGGDADVSEVVETPLESGKEEEIVDELDIEM